MPVFTPIPLGTPIPDLPHAVSCSLPTMAAVRGYEEKDPAVTSMLAAGYPRFVVHRFARQLASEIARRRGLAGQTVWLVSSRRMAENLVRYLRSSSGEAAEAFSDDGVHGVFHAASPELGGRAKLYLQHIGGFISSREAEDRLADLGLVPSTRPEALFRGDAAAEIRRHLRSAFPGAGDGNCSPASSGMNAVYAAFRAVTEVQAKRGRSIWVQLGWLYLDTILVLKKFTAAPGDYVQVSDMMDFGAIERLFRERGAQIAGVVAEIPSNPLIQTPDVAALAALCRRHGARLVLDPSIASALSVDSLSHADLVATSLTKYTGSDGDVIAGLVTVNPTGPDANALRTAVAAILEPVYPRDLARLAAQIGDTPRILARISETTPKVAAFLAAHPRVRSVYWALQPGSKENYLRIARSSASVGGMISFTLRGPLEPFYSRLRLPKGPSFGMKTTLICPFMYLAHYDLVTSDEGRRELAANGLDPDLLRLCVGIEPVEEIVAALAEALD